ncbi:MAG: recombinase family protein [Anaerolineae bacterium]|nr:recombinase family protein [Anaerolineae bacterium]
MYDLKPKAVRASHDQPTPPRFFVAPKLDDRLKELVAQSKQINPKRVKRKTVMLRYAAYLRISSEEQVGNYSIDAQHRAVQTWVQAQNGQLVKVYVDEAQSGRTAARPAFQQMRQDARKRKFDALVVHKFDRFARNRTDALAIKSLLRYDYGIKVFSVTEPSEDSDGPIGALIEGIMECVAEWYSRNLAAEVTKGRKEKHNQGYHNGFPPFGYNREGKNLIPNEAEVPGVKLAFTAYSTGQYAYVDVARLLNENGYRSTSSRPFSKDTVREILRNEIYIGRVRYQATRYNADGSRNFSAPVEWYQGQHEPIIDTELFLQCQETREERYGHHQPYKRYNPYVLRGLVYCYRCCSQPVEGADFPSWGKMHCHTRSDRRIAHYRCSSRNAGFACDQREVNVEIIDEQIAGILSTLTPPDNWRSNLVRTMSVVLGEQNLETRLAEIRGTIERMDFRWDSGFITDKVDYLEKRLKLQQELEHLTPVHEELDLAADILENFSARWTACGEDVERKHQLVKLILERVYIEDERVVAVTLKSNYHVILGHKANEPTYVEVDPMVYDWALRDSNP